MLGEAEWIIFVSDRLAPSSIESVVAHDVANVAVNVG
jgi:hypothetical protein